MKVIVLTLLTVSLATAFATNADAQPAYAAPVQRSADPQAFALAGAGGRGGAGAGAVGSTILASTSRCGAVYENRDSEYTSHVRSSAPPPMDPCRKVEIVECTQPFDAFKGNILCR